MLETTLCFVEILNGENMNSNIDLYKSIRLKFNPVDSLHYVICDFLSRDVKYSLKENKELKDSILRSARVLRYCISDLMDNQSQDVIEKICLAKNHVGSYIGIDVIDLYIEESIILFNAE